MKEVLPGIYLMELTLSGFDSGFVNTYLIKTDAGYTMIDTGWDTPDALESMVQQLAEIGAVMSDIKEVILTHAHIDHLGFVPRFKHTHRPKIYLHEREMGLIRIRFANGDSFLPLTDAFLQSHGMPASELTPPDFQLPQSDELVDTQPDVLLHEGDLITAGPYHLRVIETPGHTPGHIALYEPKKKFLFSGDMLLPTISTNAAFHVQHIPYPLELYLASLKELYKLEIDVVLPGHEYIFSDHRKRIDELLRRHEKKAIEVLRSFTDDKPKTAFEVSRGLAYSKRTGKDFWPDMTGWDRRFAVLLTIAHLESLCFNRLLDRKIQGKTSQYRLIKKDQ